MRSSSFPTALQSPWPWFAWALAIAALCFVILVLERGWP